ncbi:hypothetical protein, partial [Bradyrhizobium sp.]|uniref:hypothetical protein n=1 Tax=Bradyrhizobium sp. TaxID=376 RepID=UPI003C549CAA
MQQDVTVAKQATGDYLSGHSTAETTALDDWAAVGAVIANQYRIAWASARHREAAVAALDRQYDSYFQHSGVDTEIYDHVVASAKDEVPGEEGQTLPPSGTKGSSGTNASSSSSATAHTTSGSSGTSTTTYSTTVSYGSRGAVLGGEPFVITTVVTHAASPSKPHTPSAPPQVTKARKAIVTGAAAYRPTGPGITVDNPVVKAMMPILTKAEQDQHAAQQQVDADTSNEHTTQQQLAILNTYTSNAGLSLKAMLQHAFQLETQLRGELRQTAVAQQHLRAAKAKVAAATVVAYTQQGQSDNQTATKAAATSRTSLDHLNKLLPKGLSVKPGATLTPTQLASLSGQQRQAYFAYLTATLNANAAVAKTNADYAQANASYALLQLYASDPKAYGDIAQQAVGLVQGALSPLTVSVQHKGQTYVMPASDLLTMPGHMTPGAAQSNFDYYTQQETDFNAQWNAATAAMAYLPASSSASALQIQFDALTKQVGALQKQIDALAQDALPIDRGVGTLVDQYGAAQSALAKISAALAKANSAAAQSAPAFNLTTTYVTKLQGQQGVQTASSALNTAEANYVKWAAAHPAAIHDPFVASGGTLNPYAGQVATAQQQLALAQQESNTASAEFLAAYGQLYAMNLDAAAKAELQKVTACSTSPDSPYVISQNDHSDAVAAGSVANQFSSQASDDEAQLVVTMDHLAVTADQQAVTKLTAEYVQWNRTHPNPSFVKLALANGVSPGAISPAVANPSNPYSTALSNAKATLTADGQGLFLDAQTAQQAQGALAQANYIASLPLNLQDPQTTADKQQQQQDIETFDQTHLLFKGAINVGNALDVVNDDISGYQKGYLSTRPLVEQGYDAVSNFFGGGGTHSAALSYMEGVRSQLQAVQQKYGGGQLSRAQYVAEQTALQKILQNYGQTVSSTELQDQQGDQAFDEMEQGLEFGAELAAGIIATAASGGNVAVGMATTFAVAQAFRGAQNGVTALEGGSVMDDQGGISLVTAGVDGIKSLVGDKEGGITAAMGARAGIDGAEDAVTAASVGYGNVVAGKVTDLAVSFGLKVAGKLVGGAADVAVDTA